MLAEQRSVPLCGLAVPTLTSCVTGLAFPRWTSSDGQSLSVGTIDEVLISRRLATPGMTI